MTAVKDFPTGVLAVVGLPGAAVQPTLPPGSLGAGNRAAMISVYTGSRAEQVMMGTTIMVSMRSRYRSMVRVAMMAGMAQA